MNYKAIFIPVIGEDSSYEQEFRTFAEAEAALEILTEYTDYVNKDSKLEEAYSAGFVVEKDSFGNWVEMREDEH